MSRRTKKVGALIHGELARLFVAEVSDPRLTELSISDVEVSADLKSARVFFTCQEDKAPNKDVFTALRSVTPFLKRQLSELPLRYIPELKFEYDEAGESAGRVLRLLDDLRPKNPTGPVEANC
ncbi:MAG: 30S ribosome-binding factor RbfA [Bdellovibrionales bacterium]|nr:30S ribosome-binding factor RbfA [Bdellovibrionales bacterium]